MVIGIRRPSRQHRRNAPRIRRIAKGDIVAKPQHKYLDNVPLTRLHLDPDNPRHDPIQDEDKIIAQLFRSERVLALARNIAKNGGISPLEKIGVIEMADNPGHYFVAEGNRRICALKVLHDPRKAPTPGARSSLEALSQRASIPPKMSVVVFKDRTVARPWLELRHLGAQDGAGTRPWDTTQKARFAKGTSPDTMALEVLDRAVAAGWIDAATRNRIGITTLTRYLGNPVVRAALGLGNRGKLTFTHDPVEVDIALKQFVLDAVPRKDGSEAPVNSRTRAPDWREYGRSLHDRGLAPKTVLPTPKEPPPPARDENKKPGHPRHPDDRQCVIPSDFVASHKDKALQRLVWELRHIKADDFNFSANYLVRAVIERILVLYAKKANVFRPKMDDRSLTQACHNALEASGVHRSEIKNLRIAASNDDSIFSLQTIGAAVHGAHLPTRKSLIAVWDNWESALRMMLDRL